MWWTFTDASQIMDLWLWHAPWTLTRILSTHIINRITIDLPMSVLLCNFDLHCDCWLLFVWMSVFMLHVHWHLNWIDMNGLPRTNRTDCWPDHFFSHQINSSSIILSFVLKSSPFPRRPLSVIVTRSLLRARACVCDVQLCNSKGEIVYIIN